MAGDAESQDLTLTIRFVVERENNEVSVPNTSGRCRWKKNRLSWFHLEDRSEDYSSSEAESSSSSEEDKTQTVIRSHKTIWGCEPLDPYRTGTKYDNRPVSTNCPHRAGT